VTGEQITKFNKGAPGFLRSENADFTLANFMRAQLMSSLAALYLGFKILREKEGIEAEYLLGHGGFFNTERVGQEIMSQALGCKVGVFSGGSVSVGVSGVAGASADGGASAPAAQASGVAPKSSVSASVNQGGDWGMAVLAAYADSVNCSEPRELRGQQSCVGGAQQQMTLTEFLDTTIFKGSAIKFRTASPESVVGFKKYMDSFMNNIDRVRKI
jgi:hypothetical protein